MGDLLSHDDDSLTLSLGAWEGPLDLLLTLARSQKVDLREISILALVEQYLDYLDGAKALRLEIAADYLVMAAWLAYLKSCLLLPKDEEADPSPEELAWSIRKSQQRHALYERLHPRSDSSGRERSLVGAHAEEPPRAVGVPGADP